MWTSSNSEYILQTKAGKSVGAHENWVLWFTFFFINAIDGATTEEQSDGDAVKAHINLNKTHHHVKLNFYVSRSHKFGLQIWWSEDKIQVALKSRKQSFKVL